MNWLTNFVAGWVGLLCPPGRTGAPIPQGLARAVHALVWLAGLSWLWYEGGHPAWCALIDAPWPGMERWWLLLAGALAYLLLWLIRALLNTLRQSIAASHGSELEIAWREALAELAHTGLDIKQTPLFLMLGARTPDEEGFLESAPWSWTLKFAPAECPFHLYANPQATFVCCPDTSPIVRQTQLASPESAALPSANQFQQMQQILTQALVQGRGPDQLTAREKRRLRRLADASKTPAATLPDEEDSTPMLRALGELIRRSRLPFCSINGLLVTLPWDALAPGEDSSARADTVKRDLAEVQAGLRIECPMFVLVTGLESADGYSVWANRLTAARRREILGRVFPVMPDLDRSEVLVCWRQGLAHFADRELAKLILPALHGPKIGDDKDDIWSSNEPLLRCWGEVRSRLQSLAALLPGWLPADPHAPLLLAGCFLAATGVGHGAFATGVFEELLDKQDHVSWPVDMPAAA